MTRSRHSSGSGGFIRHRKLIDLRLQGWLLLALVVLETAMLVVALFYLHRQFSAAIDANLFTIHRSAQQPLLPLFLKELALVVVCMGAVNTLALLLAHGLWRAHLKRVLGAFRQRLQRVEQLDLRPLALRDEPRHEVLRLLERWRAREAARSDAIAGLLRRLESLNGEAPDLAKLRQWTAELDSLLQEVR